MYKHRNRTKMEKDLRQKYVISRDGAKNKLKIREYANRLDDLFLRFQTKGFMPIEIPGLIKDVFNMFGNGGYCTITAVNKEMEDLGWGLEIIDDVTYKLINSLFNKKWIASLS